jgi:O-antigen/teichoic acid export membrane protein
MLFSDAFIKAWSPWFYKYLTQLTHTKKRQIVQYTYYYIFGIFILSVFVAWIGNLILPYIVDEQYYGADQYIFWVSLGYSIFGVYQIFFPYLVHLNRTSFLAFSTMVAASLNLIFNYFFIKSFGAIGAAYATVLAFTVSAILVFIYQYRHMAMPWFNIFYKKSV